MTVMTYFEKSLEFESESQFKMNNRNRIYNRSSKWVISYILHISLEFADILKISRPFHKPGS